jgi:hypothetical protein
LAKSQSPKSHEFHANLGRRAGRETVLIEALAHNPPREPGGGAIFLIFLAATH